MVEETISKNGVYLGEIRNAKRYGFMFDKPIGHRVAKNGTRIPLYYGEVKIDSNGLYHLIPRTGPAK